MNPVKNAIRTGTGRGWSEFIQSLRSPQDQGFYLFMAVAILGFLFFNRNNTVDFDDASFSYITLALPGILGGLLGFGMMLGPGYALAMEREDGTLLRAKAVPYGLIGHVSGHVVSNTLGVIPSFLVILVPAMFLFDGVVPQGASGWLTVLWVTALGILATLPIGLSLGASVPSVQKMGTWGMLPFMGLIGISGVFVPMQSLWGWVQVVAQIFPVYWLGLGMRSAFLPADFAQFEIGGSWRTGLTVMVLVAWAVVGLAVTPKLLRRMARRQSGSTVEAAKEQALQWVR